MVLLPGIAGMAVGIIRPRLIGGSARLWRFLALFTLLLAISYSVIPYKTPWNVLGILFGFVLLAGAAAACLYRAVPSRVFLALIGVGFAAGFTQYAMQSYRANFRFYADDRNPYVYAGTAKDTMNLVERVHAIADIDPAGKGMLIQIMAPASDYWPLPWYLRQYTNMGFYEEVPPQMEGAVVIAATSMEESVDLLLGDLYHKEYFGLRSEVMLLVYVRQDLWTEFIEARSAQ